MFIPKQQVALCDIKVTICKHPLYRRSIVMAGHMKVLNDYIFAGAKSVFFVVLLTIIPRISHQNTGKKCLFYFEAYYK